ncbi:hypothetical protein HJFPF1_05191 [Paramyrothecium foliicola]|nr:hypothetical protein HJFPF1_05191 [Paramyrothecium foliicola]
MASLTGVVFRAVAFQPHMYFGIIIQGQLPVRNAFAKIMTKATTIPVATEPVAIDPVTDGRFDGCIGQCTGV